MLLFACKIRRKDLQQTLIFLFVLFIPILYLFLIYFRNKNKINNLYKVKYDYNQKKLSWILSCISTIITITLLAIRNLPITEHLPDEIVVFVYLGGYIFFPIITLILWLDFLRSTMYLKRLKSYGYEIPVNKKDFDSSLYKLPKTTPATVNPDERNKGSLILSGLSLCGFSGTVINIIVFYFKYELKGDLAYFGAIYSIPALIFWFVQSFIFWNQSSNEKYCDDIEADINRKQRKPFENGIVNIIVCLILTVLYMIMVYKFSDFVYKTRVNAGYYQ